MVEETLRHLDSWYRDSTEGAVRPKLLSKFAMLELCGWLEERFDSLVRDVDSRTLNDRPWVTEHVLSRTNGFHYGDHLRPMICKVLGEVVARKTEAAMEQRYPGELDRLKSTLGDLWKKRCGFAHADVGANVAAQQVFDAPSWSLNQLRILKRLIQHYEEVLGENL